MITIDGEDDNTTTFVSDAGTAVAGTITGDGGKVAGKETVAKTDVATFGGETGVGGATGLGGAATGLGGAATGLGGATTGLGGAGATGLGTGLGALTVGTGLGGAGLGDLAPAEAEAVVEIPLELITC
jgi:hypothetical protein